MSNLILTEISTSSLTYDPGQQATMFEVTVTNQSDRFAAFRVELLAVGANQKEDSQAATAEWYRLAPNISSKIPGGDRTKFEVEILGVPPISEDFAFTGTVNLTVRVYSIELETEDRQVIRLLIPGKGSLPPYLILPDPNVSVAPLNTIELPVSINNPNRQAIDVILRLRGLPRPWVKDGLEQHIHLLAKDSKKTFFTCQIPAPVLAAQRDYPLIFEAAPITGTDSFLPVHVNANLTVLPGGQVELLPQPPFQTLPEQPRRWLNPIKAKATIQLRFANRSNVEQSVELFCQYQVFTRKRKPQRRFRFPWQPKPPVEVDDTLVLSLGDRPLEASLTLSNRRLDLGIDSSERPTEVTESLTIEQYLPWIGIPREKDIEIQAELANPQLDLQGKNQIIPLKIYPVIPLWLQGFILLLLITLFGTTFFKLGHVPHLGGATSVEFNDRGDEAISVGKDGRIRLWWVRKGSLRLKETLNRNDRTNRSIRVVKYRPINNDQAVVGFENGQIELWNLLPRDPVPFSTISQDDRIFDLALPEDARSVYADADAVFSGHGSGMVVQRSFSAPGSSPQLLFDRERDYAVQALSLVGMGQQYLAIAGRKNQLDIMDLGVPQSPEPLAKIPYQEGGVNDYIVSLDSPLNRPNMLGASDTKGFVSIWTIEPCVAEPDEYGNRGDCKLLDEWSGVSDAITRAIAFTSDGCFLATGGDEGIIKVWPLTPLGVRDPDFPNGKIIDVLKTSVNAVDIMRVGDRITVVSGADDGYIRLKSVPLKDFPHEGEACPRL